MSEFIRKEGAVSNLLRDGLRGSEVIVTDCDKREGGILKIVKLSPMQRMSVLFLLLCILTTLCDALRNLVLFVQFKKREKRPWRNVTFSKDLG